MCLGVEPGVAGLKAQTNPLSYDGAPFIYQMLLGYPLTIKQVLEML